MDGLRVVVFRCTAEEAAGFDATVQAFEPGRFYGCRVRFSGRLRAREMTGWAGLWMRVDGPPAGTRRTLAFHNYYQDRDLTGPTDWQIQHAVLDISEEAPSR